MKHLKLVWTIAAVVALSAVIASQTPSGHARLRAGAGEGARRGQPARKPSGCTSAWWRSSRRTARSRRRRSCRSACATRSSDAMRPSVPTSVSCATLPIRKMPWNKRACGWPCSNDLRPVRRLPRRRPECARFRGSTNNAVLALSPDGTKAAFIIYDKGQNLAVYDVASQQTTRLTDFDWTPHLPGWTPPPGRPTAGASPTCSAEHSGPQLRAARGHACRRVQRDLPQ